MNHKKSFITFGVILASIVGSASPVSAEQIVVTISDNGSGSSNEVKITSQTETTVEQNNSATIENHVSAQANTGNNSANGNTGGDTTIETGDVVTKTTVENHAINHNSANASSAGPVSGTVAIRANGANSNNKTESTVNHSAQISQNNNANITNNVYTNANTGLNNANYNSGQTTIKTGNIFAESTVENKKINNSIAKILGGCNADCIISNEMILKIFGNGEGTVNNLKFNYDDTKTYDSNNLANIFNNVVHELNTGGNSASKNNGDVSILTGDIHSKISVVNHDINTNIVEIECGCKTTPPNPEEPTTPPTKPTPGNGGGGNGGSGNGGSGSSSAGSSGDVLGTSIGEILPATGSNFLLWATIASLIFFFSGWYLRFRSGCAPGLAR